MHLSSGELYMKGVLLVARRSHILPLNTLKSLTNAVDHRALSPAWAAVNRGDGFGIVWCGAQPRRLRSLAPWRAAVG